MIKRHDESDVAVIQLAHGKVNALDLELVRAIAETFRSLEHDPARAIVLTGTDRAFSAGVDLGPIIEGGADYVRSFLPALVDAFLAVFRLGKPVVAAVNGHAIAGGAVLVSACDRRLMAGGRIGVTELRVGVPFPVAAMEILSYAMGSPQARVAVLAGETYDPTGAAHVGLVDGVVADEDLLDRATTVAQALADAIPADVYRHTKHQLHAGAEERIARWAPQGDAEATRLWIEAASSGRLAQFMKDVLGRRR